MDITIAFSGFNIRHFAVLAIESFLHFYPEHRKNIVYFDDFSTDRTREDLEKRGIRVISWSKDIYDEYMKLVSEDYFKNTTQAMSTRVCYIMRDIMNQVSTKYLMISDGDVMFISGGFLEKHLSELKKGSRIVFHEEPSLFSESDGRWFKSINEDAYHYYSKFNEPYTGSLHAHMPQNEKYWSSPRVHLLQAIMDLEYFKSINMIGDRLDERNTVIMYGGLVDTGTDFYHQIREHEIPYSIISDKDLHDSIKHWGWLSSSNRDIDNGNLNSLRDRLGELESILNSREAFEILKSTGLSMIKILHSYKVSQARKKLY